MTSALRRSVALPIADCFSCLSSSSLFSPAFMWRLATVNLLNTLSLDTFASARKRHVRNGGRGARDGGRYRGRGTAVIGDGGTVGANHLGLCLCGRAQGLCGVERKDCAGWSARVVRGADHGADHAVTLMVALMVAHG